MLGAEKRWGSLAVGRIALTVGSLAVGRIAVTVGQPRWPYLRSSRLLLVTALKFMYTNVYDVSWTAH